jgi:cytidylate kinase
MAEQRAQAKARVTPEPPRPIITISREAGANGTELGRRVADQMGFRFWDQELVQQIAERSGPSEALFAAVDERARSAIQDLLAGVLMGDAATETEYLARLMCVIHTITQHGSAVVMGRGAQFVVPSDAALRVRVVGLLEARVRSLGTARGLSEREARSEIERIDRERLAFVRHHYHRNAADPSAYDLVVNTATVPGEQAVDVVVAAYRAKFPRGH